MWRIYFVCDLNVKNIQNWLFTPIISTRLANRLLLNLTYTIRECEQFPKSKIVKSCRERFELYYEEYTDDEYMSINKNNQYDYTDNSNNNNNNNNAGSQVNQNSIDTSIYLLNKIKTFKFHDTFVSDSALKYNNNKEKKLVPNDRTTINGDLINIELRDVPISANKTYIQFGIRDTGACISLLALDASYITCPKLVKHGITFPETTTGRDVTDLIQVNGVCPLYSTNSQTPKALCTGKGMYLQCKQWSLFLFFIFFYQYNR